jgi:hypothetical protein
MEFIQNNAGNIVVGCAVFAVLIFAIVRLINNARKGKTACGCGCGGCSKCG